MNRHLNSTVIKGAVCAVTSAVCYALNPLGSLFLYREGANVHSVLFCRFLLAVLLLAGWMLLRRISFAVTRQQFGLLAILGTLFGASAYWLYTAFRYMDSGLACSLLFVYPVMVAALMALFFRERLTRAGYLSMAMALGGVALLYHGEAGAALHTGGVALVMLSALAYAVYIVIVNRAKFRMPVVPMTFYILLFCGLTIGLTSFLSADTRISFFTTPYEWAWVLFLAVVPGILSTGVLTVAIRSIGSTPTSIIMALEPITAVLIGTTVFAEPFTLRYAAGILLILTAVTLIILCKARREMQSST